MKKQNEVLLLKSPEDQLAQTLTHDEEEWARAVRFLNDAFRISFTSTELYCSPAIVKLSLDEQSVILERVRNYRNFTEKNDPDMTHRHGFIEYEDLRLVWEIQYLDKEAQNISPDPLNLNLTQRYMMVMLEGEWWGDLPEDDS